MPVRLRITLLFTAIVFLILGIVCVSVYYFSLQNRSEYIETRLKNVAITTGRFLSRAEYFNPTLIQKIDSLTAIAFQRKTVQVYDEANKLVYIFHDVPNDSIPLSISEVNEIRKKTEIYKSIKGRDVVFYHYVDEVSDLVIVAAGYDYFGRDTLDQLLFLLTVSFVAGVIIAIISGYVFSRRLLAPLRGIAEEVKEISAQNLARRIETRASKDEWYQLSSTFNELLDRLQESFELQKRFVANASHELSTPLTAISSQLEVSLQKERSAAEYQKTLESIYQDIHHLGKLTHTLLEFAKASGTKGGIETKLIRIDEIILELPAELSKINPNYSISLHYDHFPEDPQNLLVYGNEELLFTAIKNVALNACKYSFDHQAKILLNANEKDFIITIENIGSEIPIQEQDKIFEPFYRIEQNRTAGGFGLGLSLTRRIIKLHRGQISVRSQHGLTEFVIQLPAARFLKSGE